MGVSRYVSQFKAEKKEEAAIAPAERKPIIREKKEVKSTVVEKLSKIQDLTQRFKESEVSIEVVDKTVDEINTIIKDVIDEVGSTNPVINTLINAAAEVETIAADVAPMVEPEMAGEAYPSLDGVLGDESEINLESPELEFSPEMEIAPEMEAPVGEESVGGPEEYDFSDTVAIDDDEGMDIGEEEKEEEEEEEEK
jgi:hypothetical protein